MPTDKENKTKSGSHAVPPPPPPRGSSFYIHQKEIVDIINNNELNSGDKLKHYNKISDNIKHDENLDSKLQDRLMSMLTRAKVSAESAAPKGRIAEMQERLAKMQAGAGVKPASSSAAYETKQQPGKLNQAVASGLGALLGNRKPPKPSVSLDASTAAPSTEQPVRPKGPPAFLAGIAGGVNLKKTAGVNKTAEDTLRPEKSQKPTGAFTLAEAAVAGRAGLRRTEKSPGNNDKASQAAAPSELEKKLAARRAKELMKEVRSGGDNGPTDENQEDTSNKMKP